MDAEAETNQVEAETTWRQFLDKGRGMIHDVEIGGGHYNIENKNCNIQSNNI